jgi:glutamine synthetase
MSDNKAEIWLAQHPEIDSIFACVCDLNGTMRGKRVPVDQLSKVIDGGLRMPLSIVGMDIWGEDVENSELVFETGDSDGLCDFTGRPLMPVTWTSRPTARCRWTNCNTSMNF